MNSKILAVAATLAVALAACGGSKTANLSLSAKAATASTPTSTPSTPATIDAGNGISISEIRIVVRKLKLEGTVATADGGSSARSAITTVNSQRTDTGAGESESGPGEDGRTEVEREQDDAKEPVLGPLLADVTAASLVGGIEQIFNGQVPEGTFNELKFAVGPVTAAPSGAGAQFAEMVSKNASIIIDYTITDSNGKTSPSLQFVSSLTAQFSIEGNIVVSASKANNITLGLDSTRWFVSGTAFLDPRVDANKAAIENNIKASIQAFQDDDRSGIEDRRESSERG